MKFFFPLSRTKFPGEKEELLNSVADSETETTAGSAFLDLERVQSSAHRLSLCLSLSPLARFLSVQSSKRQGKGDPSEKKKMREGGEKLDLRLIDFDSIAEKKKGEPDY